MFISLMMVVIYSLGSLFISKVIIILDWYYFPPEIPNSITSWSDPLSLMIFVITFAIIVTFLIDSHLITETIVMLVLFLVFILIGSGIANFLGNVFNDTNRDFWYSYKNLLLVFIIFSFIVIGAYGLDKPVANPNSTFAYCDHAIISVLMGFFYGTFLLFFGPSYALAISLILISVFYITVKVTTLIGFILAKLNKNFFSVKL